MYLYYWLACDTPVLLPIFFNNVLCFQRNTLTVPCEQTHYRLYLSSVNDEPARDHIPDCNGKSYRPTQSQCVLPLLFRGQKNTDAYI
jgi:hypothetical protein